jgi:hypothetical protein
MPPPPARFVVPSFDDVGTTADSSFTPANNNNNNNAVRTAMGFSPFLNNAARSSSSSSRFANLQSGIVNDVGGGGGGGANSRITTRVLPWPTSAGSSEVGDVDFDANNHDSMLDDQLTPSTVKQQPVSMLAAVFGAEGSQSAQYDQIVEYFRYDATQERRTAAADMPQRRLHESAFARALIASDDSFVRARLFAEICDKRQIELRPSSQSSSAASSSSSSVSVASTLLMTAENRSREAHANSLQCERDVWLLLEWLYADRRESYERRAALRAAAAAAAAAGDDEVASIAAVINDGSGSNARTKSRRDVMLRALSADDELRELSIVVRWLERTYDAALAPPAPLTASWHGTVRALTERRLGASASAAASTTKASAIELDIDAAYRTQSIAPSSSFASAASTTALTTAATAGPKPLIGIGRSTVSTLIPTTTSSSSSSSSAVVVVAAAAAAATAGALTNVLERGDAADEAQLHRELWRLVRGGRIAAAQQLARNAKQPWRATALGGGLLHHDARRKQRRAAVADGGDDDVDATTTIVDGSARQGNLTRQAWKAACWALLRASGGDAHERATFAALCGSLSGMLPVCSDWRDYAWAYLRALLERRADAHLAAQPDYRTRNSATGGANNGDDATSASNDDDDDDAFDEPEERNEGEVEITRAAYEAVRDGDMAPPPTLGECLGALRHGSLPAGVRGSLATSLSSETKTDAEAYRRIATMAIAHVGMDQLLCTLARWLAPPSSLSSSNSAVASAAVATSSSSSMADGDDAVDIVPTRQLARFAAHCALFFNAVDASNSDLATRAACRSLLVNASDEGE